MARKLTIWMDDGAFAWVGSAAGGTHLAGEYSAILFDKPVEMWSRRMVGREVERGNVLGSLQLLGGI